MSYKDQMRVNPSKGEAKLTARILWMPCLQTLLLNLETVAWFTDDDVKLVDKNFITKDMVEFSKEERPDQPPFSVPDWIFRRPKGGKELIVYLDGPIHLTPHNSERDEKINMILEAAGHAVMRLEYTTAICGIQAHINTILAELYPKGTVYTANCGMLTYSICQNLGPCKKPICYPAPEAKNNG